ncbi:nuclear transport factor 2 family protein [Flagellimonas sp. S174]|uniref:nuclear transport factor 2 family protein n=1 Tax=Flagellimonas sp. S174 TaxID=3410790 RepID=UPI003BF55DED
MNNSKKHPNLMLIEQIEDPSNLPKNATLFHEDVVWRFFNPKLPDMEGDYAGLDGIGNFFSKLMNFTEGTFKPNTIRMIPIGSELVLMHNINELEINGKKEKFDVALVWRIVDGKIKEIWDIPAVY